MRKLTRYTVFSIFKIGMGTAMLATLMLLGVDLFTNLDSYMNNNVGFLKAFGITMLYVPEAFLFALGPAFMFAVTYHLSMMQANNEAICISSAGISRSRILIPIILFGIVLTAFHFGFNETVAIGTSNRKAVRMKNLSFSSGSLDNSEIALSGQGYLVFADAYVESMQSIFGVSLVETAEDGSFLRRTDSYKAQWDPSIRKWIFSDAWIYEPSEKGIEISNTAQYISETMDLEPRLFRESADDITTMPLKEASEYLKSTKTINKDKYASLGTEYYKRLLGCLTPLVMILISCSMNYKFKKNVMFMSLLSSVALAVVYYVVQMITTMMADQGIIRPYMGTLVPFIAVALAALLLNMFFSRR